VRIFNFAHPLTAEQLQEIRSLLGADSGAGSGNLEVIEIPSHVLPDEPLEPQVEEMLRRCQLSLEQWQTEPFLINLPALSASAAALLAKLHGLMGYFPPVLRIVPVEEALPPRFRIAEILNLQAFREKARRLRGDRFIENER
jgi:hypothetical protein